MFFIICFPCGVDLETPTIENITFLSSAIVNYLNQKCNGKRALTLFNYYLKYLI
jgi:hypothetical protein